MEAGKSGVLVVSHNSQALSILSLSISIYLNLSLSLRDRDRVDTIITLPHITSNNFLRTLELTYIQL